MKVSELIKELEKTKKDGDFPVKLCVEPFGDINGFSCCVASDGGCFWNVYTENSIPGKIVVISAER